MVNAAPAERTACCPHVERNDIRCGTRFRLDRINQAFSVCFGAYHGCPMFHRINAEADAEAKKIETRRQVLITVAGHGIQLPLRPTGT